MKISKLLLCLLISAVFIHSSYAAKRGEKSDREIWCSIAYKMAAPVLENMSK